MKVKYKNVKHGEIIFFPNPFKIFQNFKNIVELIKFNPYFLNSTNFRIQIQFIFNVSCIRHIYLLSFLSLLPIIKFSSSIYIWFCFQLAINNQWNLHTFFSSKCKGNMAVTRKYIAYSIEFARVFIIILLSFLLLCRCFVCFSGFYLIKGVHEEMKQISRKTEKIN